MITELPPQQAPKQLTARHMVQTLGEHLQGFLAVNNIHGYLDDPDYVFRDDKVNDILIVVGIGPGLKLEKIKDTAKTIRKITDRQIGHGHALELIARALGYKTYFLASRCADNNGFVQNVWKGHNDWRGFFFEEEVISSNDFANKTKNVLIGRLYALHAERNKAIIEKAKKVAEEKKRLRKLRAERQRLFFEQRQQSIVESK